MLGIDPSNAIASEVTYECSKQGHIPKTKDPRIVYQKEDRIWVSLDNDNILRRLLKAIADKGRILDTRIELGLKGCFPDYRGLKGPVVDRSRG